MVEVDRYGRLPLHYAALGNDIAVAKARLAAGDDVNLGDRKGLTPLHMAAQQWSVDVAKLLLDHGAEVDRLNRFGNTPLFVAVFNSKGRGDLITLLRERGADPLTANHSGQTPLGLARLIGNYDVARFFADLPNQPDSAGGYKSAP
jgi:ankyrin repeat protein